MRKKAAFLTLGCKVNQYETDAMTELLTEDGYEIVEFKDGADVIVVHTCSVTNMADKKSRQMIQRAKRNNPDSIVVAVGCYVQANRQALEETGVADILIGNNQKGEIAHVLRDYFKNKEKKEYILDINKEKEYESLNISNVKGHTRAYIKIQDGCNQFCSYCIIPYARGRVRSERPERILQEVRSLADRGFKEIVLTGIHLGSYGQDLEDISLLDIIMEIAKIDGVERIRLGSLEPRTITEEFIQTISANEKICPHFHLSLQSGCDETLRRMNRKYTTKEYEEAVNLIRRYYDRPAITTDVIAGFVGETEEEFEKTVAFLEKINLYEMHIFKYSVRAGTKAEKMEGHIPETKKAERSAVLLELAAKNKKSYEEQFIGDRDEVLIEEKIEIDGKEYYQGYTKRYLRVVIPCEEKELIPNQIEPVVLENLLGDNLLLGKLLIEF